PGGERRLVDRPRAAAVVIGGYCGRASCGGRPVARSNGGGDRGGRLRGESAFADQSLHGCGEFAELIGASAEAAPGSQDVEGHVDGHAAVQEVRQRVNGESDRLARGGAAVEGTNRVLG